MTRESQISREIQRFLKQVGCAVYSTEQGYRRDRGGTRTSPGIPDLIVIHPTAWTFAELKTETGKLTMRQLEFREDARSAGIPWQLWRDVRHAFDWCVAVGIVEEAA